MTDVEILQKNLAAADADRRRADAIEAGQISECVQLLRKQGATDLSPKNAASRFHTVFGERPLLSSLYAKYILQLQKSGMIDTRLFVDKRFPVYGCKLYYSRSPYTDTAIAKFASVLSSPALCPEEDLQAICEAVSSEEHSYGILPIFGTIDGELPAFTRMIHAYQLKTCAVCDILTSDGETELRLALLSADLQYVPDATYMDLSFLPESGKSLAEALSTLSHFGADIHRIIARPLEYNRSRFLYRITLFAAPEAFSGIAAFARTAMNAGIDGVYPIL